MPGKARGRTATRRSGWITVSNSSSKSKIQTEQRPLNLAGRSLGYLTGDSFAEEGKVEK